jgi:hypothetical protein
VSGKDRWSEGSPGLACIVGDEDVVAVPVHPVVMVQEGKPEGNPQACLAGRGGPHQTQPLPAAPKNRSTESQIASIMAINLVCSPRGAFWTRNFYLVNTWLVTAPVTGSILTW